MECCDPPNMITEQTRRDLPGPRGIREDARIKPNFKAGPDSSVGRAAIFGSWGREFETPRHPISVKDIALQWDPTMTLLPGGPASSVIQAIGRVIPVDREVPGLECRWRHMWFADDARKSRWPPYKRECAGTEGRWRHMWNKTTSLSQGTRDLVSIQWSWEAVAAA